MKVALTVCEYNPLHNGHVYSLNKIKSELNPDLLVVIMSGNFTQRGEIAVMHKYVRAKHALLAGADLVVELPTVFATANAEIFAKGAVKIAESLGGNRTLCFGVESGDKAGLIATATLLNSETKEFKQLLKEELSSGVSFAKARYNALEKMNIPDADLGFAATPNNILALEYTKSIIENGFKTDVLPLHRVGAGYSDLKSVGEFASAKGIRELIAGGGLKKVKKFLPDFVFSDLPDELPNTDEFIAFELLKADKNFLSSVLDCSEGLENRMKALVKDTFSRSELINKMTTKRYTSSRISRIMLANMLAIDQAFIKKCLKSKLYLKVLAVKKDKLDYFSTLQSDKGVPFIMRKNDADNLSGTAKECFLKEVFANDVFNFITKQKTNEYFSLIV